MEKINGIVAIMIAMMIAFSGVASAVPVTSFENLLGDVDGNGIVDEEDIRLMTIAQTNHLTASECGVWGVVVDEFPDVNNDSVFGYDDIQSIEYLYSMLAPGHSTGVVPCPPTVVCPQTTSVLIGDVNEDGRIDTRDVRDLARSLGKRVFVWGRIPRVVIGHVGQVLEVIGW